MQSVNNRSIKISRIKIIRVFRLFLLTIFVGCLGYFIFLNFIKEDPVQLRDIVYACGEYPPNFVKQDISNNPNYVFERDSSYQSKVLWDEFNNLVIVNSFIECEHYFSDGWNYFSKEYYIENQEKSCLQLDKLKDKNLDNGIVYFENISLKKFFVDKNSLCIGRIKNLSIDSNVYYYEIYYSRTAYIFITQIIPVFFMIYFLKLNWYRFVIFLFLYQIFSQLIFNFYIGLNMFNSVSIYSSLALLLIKLKDKNELKI